MIFEKNEDWFDIKVSSTLIEMVEARNKSLKNQSIGFA